MTEKQPLASKNTIDNLIANSSMVIDELYKSLKGELIVRSLMNNSTPTLYILTQDLQNGIKFMLMDIGVACKAELSVENVYEKRFHIKNIYASISEGYKLLFNFGKSRKESLWKKLMEKLQENSNPDLIAEGLEIENRLVDFETNIDKELRDFTYHYDKQMFEVYQKTVSVNSEEDVMQKVCIFWEILQDIILFTKKVDTFCFVQTRIKKTSSLIQINHSVNSLHKNASNLIKKDGKLEDLFDKLSPETIKDIDLMAKKWDSARRIKEYIHNNTEIGEMPEIAHVQILTNLQMLLKFMKLDIQSIVRAYIKSSSNIEYALNLRKVCITKVSTIVHIYGYNEDERSKSIWKQIENIIPVNSLSLRQESYIIANILEKMTSNSNDKNLRNRFIHLFDNSKKCADIADVLEAIEEINPVMQIMDIYLLLEIYKLLMNFTTSIMDTLVNNSHERVLQSTKEINDKMDKFIQIIVNSSLSEEYKSRMHDMFNELKRKINTTIYS